MPELLESLYQVALQTVGVDAIEIISAKIVVVARGVLQVTVIFQQLRGFRTADTGHSVSYAVELFRDTE